MVQLTLIGTDYHDVPPSRLRVLSERTEQIRTNLVDLRERGAIQGGVLLSTCNRIEAVLDVDGVEAAPEALSRTVLGCPEGFPFHTHQGPDSVHHLLRVAAGLESMVLGEEQILGQVGRAFQESEELGLMSRPLHMLRTRLLQSARDLRRRAGLSRARSVAALAADRVFTAGPRLGVVGAGETGRLALEVLQRRGAKDVLVVNRTLAKAESLAQHFGGRAMSLAEFQAQRPALDGILFAVQSPNALLAREDLQDRKHPAHPGLSCIVDVSQPSVLDPGLRDLPELKVFDLDDLARDAAAAARAQREAADIGGKQAAARAEAIWRDLDCHRTDLGRVVQLHVENALSELDKAMRGPLRDLGDDQRDKLRQVFEKTARRHAHFHVTDLRQLLHS